MCHPNLAARFSPLLLNQEYVPSQAVNTQPEDPFDMPLVLPSPQRDPFYPQVYIYICM